MRQYDDSVAPDVRAILDEAGISVEGAKGNKRVVNAILDWRVSQITRPSLMTLLASLLESYPAIARRPVRRKRLTNAGSDFIEIYG